MKKRKATTIGNMQENKWACSYCDHLLEGQTIKDFPPMACSKQTVNNKYKEVEVLGDSDNGCIDPLSGCEEFKSSGLTTNCGVYKKLIKNNKLCENVS